MSSKSDQPQIQDAPGDVSLLLPTQEEQKDICYVDANRTKETHDDDDDSTTGDYSYILLHSLESVLKFSIQNMHGICRKDQACYQSQNLV